MQLLRNKDDKTYLTIRRAFCKNYVAKHNLSFKNKKGKFTLDFTTFLSISDGISEKN